MKNSDKVGSFKNMRKPALLAFTVTFVFALVCCLAAYGAGSQSGSKSASGAASTAASTAAASASSAASATATAASAPAASASASVSAASAASAVSATAAATDTGAPLSQIHPSALPDDTSTASCLACHDYDELAATTVDALDEGGKTVFNPHAGHVEFECTDCHSVDSQPVLRCNVCHYMTTPEGWTNPDSFESGDKPQYVEPGKIYGDLGYGTTGNCYGVTAGATSSSAK